MKIEQFEQFEQLKHAMLVKGWTCDYNAIPLTGAGTRWRFVFTKGNKCFYSDLDVWYSKATDKKYITTEQLYKKITKGNKMKQPTLKIKKFYPNGPTPVYATSGSAGIDLYAPLQEDSITLESNAIHFINTGIAVSIPKGYVGLITPRSGLGTKGLVLGNLTGVIDSDYRGEIILQLWNRSDTTITINNLDRVAQMLIVPVVQPIIKVVDELDATERGDKGFGSTGV